MLQTSFDHLTLQLIGVLLNSWVHRECKIPRSIGFDLSPNAFVIVNEPFVGHIFHAHSQLLYGAIVAALLPGKSAHDICVHEVYPKRDFLSPMTGAALESTLLNASFAPRDSSQSHAVFTGRTHRSVSNGT